MEWKVWNFSEFWTEKKMEFGQLHLLANPVMVYWSPMEKRYCINSQNERGYTGKHAQSHNVRLIEYIQ